MKMNVSTFYQNIGNSILLAKHKKIGKMILKKLYFPRSSKISKQVSIYISVFKLSQEYIIENVLVILIFLVKLNFLYKKMTEKKMYENLLEKYKNSVFRILEICKAFSNFDFDLRLSKKIHWVVQLFGNKVI